MNKHNTKNFNKSLYKNYKEFSAVLKNYLKKITMYGFTLIELMAVIAIIIVLVALLSPALNKVMEQAQEKKAKAMVGALEVGTNMYYTDQGSYPGDLGDLLSPPAGYESYMDNKDFDGSNFVDPWDSAYQYSNTANTYHIWTNAPDGDEIGVQFP